MVEYPVFIPNAGGCIASLNALSGPGRVRWAVRNRPMNSADSGWQFLSPFDSAEYVADPQNLRVVDYNQMCALEPALIGIWNHPVGSDYEVSRGEEGIVIIDSRSGRVVPRELMFVPPRFRES